MVTAPKLEQLELFKDQKSKQLRLFPYENPLVLRMGTKFCRSIPKTAGVYLMSDDAGTIIYVGKAKNLNQRVRSYFYQKPENASRKTVQLISEIHHIRWQLEENEIQALLKENEFIRCHQPKFNVLSKDFHTYPFQHLGRVGPSQIEMKLSFHHDPAPLTHVFGCFKSRSLAYQTQLALARLVYFADAERTDLFSLPRSYLKKAIGSTLVIQPQALEPEHLFSMIRRFYEGKSNRLSQFLTERIEGRQLAESVNNWIQIDLETLSNFYARAARHQKRMIKSLDLKEKILKQASLDDERIRYSAQLDFARLEVGTI